MAESSSDASELSAKVSTLSIGPSLPMRSRDKTYVSIFCPSPMNQLLLIRVSLHSLLSPNRKKIMSKSLHNNSYDLQKHYTTKSCLHPSKLTKYFTDFWSMCGISTSSVGGLGPCIFLFDSNQVFRYNLLHYQPHKSRFHKCANMAAAIKDYNALCVQFGDFLYVLTYTDRPVLQKYDIEKDIWTLVKDNIITRCNYTDEYNLSMNTVPHVVINRKLHISLGYNSFAFDTEMDTWEYSNLFDTFWSKNSQFNFQGQKRLWGPWKFINRPFGFYGREIVWDKDILLAVPLYSSKCQLVAFLLNDNEVVLSQPFTLTDHVFEGVQLVDLGQDYFGLLHCTTSCVTAFDILHNLELVTILVSKPPQPRSDCDCFLQCQIVRKDIVARNLSESAINAYKAFSV